MTSNSSSFRSLITGLSPGKIAFLVLVIAFALMLVDTPSPKIFVKPLRTFAEDMDYLKKAMNVLVEKGTTYQVYEDLFFEQKVKFIYAPSSLLLFWPLAHLTDEGFASFLDLFFRIIAIVGALFVPIIFAQTWKLVVPDAKSPWIDKVDLLLGFGSIVTLALIFYPYQLSVHQIQAQTLIATLLGLGILAHLKKWSVVEGICFGLAASLKPQSLVLLLWGVWRKEWKVVASLTATVALVYGGATLFFGWSNTITYFFRVLPQLSNGEAYFPNQSTNGLLNRLVTSGLNTEWSYHVYPSYDPIVAWGTRLTSFLFLGLALFRPGTKSMRDNSGLYGALDLALILLALTMVSPIAWEHHFGFVIAIFALLVPFFALSREVRPGIMIWLMVAYLLIGLRWWQPHVFADQGFLTLLQSLMYFGTILLFGILYYARNKSATALHGPVQ